MKVFIKTAYEVIVLPITHLVVKVVSKRETQYEGIASNA